MPMLISKLVILYVIHHINDIWITEQILQKTSIVVVLILLIETEASNT